MVAEAEGGAMVFANGSVKCKDQSEIEIKNRWLLMELERNTDGRTDGLGTDSTGAAPAKIKKRIDNGDSD